MIAQSDLRAFLVILHFGAFVPIGLLALSRALDAIHRGQRWRWLFAVYDVGIIGYMFIVVKDVIFPAPAIPSNTHDLWPFVACLALITVGAFGSWLVRTVFQVRGSRGKRGIG